MTGEKIPTNKEVAAHIRKYFETEHSIWSWATDGCGYEQHIRFVHHRNDHFKGGGRDEFRQFALDYADMLDKTPGTDKVFP